MRERTRIQLANRDSHVQYGTNLGFGNWSNFQFPYSYAYGGNSGPMYLSYERILDEITPKRDKYTYRECHHTKSTPARIENDRFYQYSPPTPEAACHFGFSFEYRPYGLPMAPSEPWGDLVDQLASIVSGKVKYQWQSPVSLWEIGQTIQMIRNPFRLFDTNLIRKPKYRKLSAKKLANAGANIWLESYYGWKSCYQDIGSAAKALAGVLYTSNYLQDSKYDAERLSASSKRVFAQDATQYVVGATAADWNWSTSQGLNSSSGGMGGVARLLHVHDEVEYTVSCSQLQSSFRQIQQADKWLKAAGLASTNWRDIRDTIWEVIPFSFVVDWFINTRGIWAPLNKFRLAQADILQIGYSSKRSCEYDVELFLTRPDFLYYANDTSWGYRIPYNVVGGRYLRSTSRGKLTQYDRHAGFPPDVLVDSAFLAQGLKGIQCLNAVTLLTQLKSKTS